MRFRKFYILPTARTVKIKNNLDQRLYTFANGTQIVDSVALTPTPKYEHSAIQMAV